MSTLVVPREPRHGSGRWEAVRDALENNERTFRFCLMSIVDPAAAVIIAELMRHILLRGLIAAISRNNPG